ncbi:MAG: type II toxin-antitoxin system VapC family toxin [Chthoniobacterales bacterium]
MLGIDTNILAYARLADSPWHRQAAGFLESLRESSEVVIGEQTLVELYLLLRNDKILSPSLGPAQAVAECDLFRSHPRWRLVDAADVMDDVWPLAAVPGFPRRRIIDVRLAKTLQHHGVREFATANTRDFEGLGFRRVYNPLAA